MTINQVERNGFGEHVWEINIDIIPKLLYWCKMPETTILGLTVSDNL